MYILNLNDGFARQQEDKENHPLKTIKKRISQY